MAPPWLAALCGCFGAARQFSWHAEGALTKQAPGNTQQHGRTLGRSIDGPIAGLQCFSGAHGSINAPRLAMHVLAGSTTIGKLLQQCSTSPGANEGEGVFSCSLLSPQIPTRAGVHTLTHTPCADALATVSLPLLHYCLGKSTYAVAVMLVQASHRTHATTFAWAETEKEEASSHMSMGADVSAPATPSSSMQVRCCLW